MWFSRKREASSDEEQVPVDFSTIPAISIHVPKCAGTSLKTMLVDTLGEKAMFDYGDKVVDTTVGARKLRLRRKKEMLGKAGSLTSARIIHGHFYATKYLDLFPDAAYLTVLRRPDALLFSYYNYLRNQSRNTHLVNHAKAMTSFSDFIEATEFQNIITKLCWPLRPEDFAAIGFVEDFEGAMAAYSSLLGTTMQPVRRNVGAPVENSPVGEYLDRIRQLNAADYAFYDRAFELFGTKLQAPGQDRLSS